MILRELLLLPLMQLDHLFAPLPPFIVRLSSGPAQILMLAGSAITHLIPGLLKFLRRLRNAEDVRGSKRGCQHSIAAHFGGLAH